ncbi:MAG: hypothetical protein K940chlam1_00274 [Candidatus Anoxychlamydiales bacterium]|nr:hypothetical protein [Candidatus Anoxychlamydiales bacterium]NGX35596.1 hypothetical protein [Candidatus Anoxychlamydiales bacterium]
MSYESNLKVLTSVNLNKDLLEYSNESFHKVGSLKKIIYIVKNIFNTLIFSYNNAFENCKLHQVAHHIYAFLEINNKKLTKDQFSFIKKHFEVLHNKAKKRNKTCVGDLNFVKTLIEKLEKSKKNKSWFSSK